MDQTSTAITACDVVAKLDNDAGVLVDISGASNRISIRRTTRVSGGTYTFGSAFPVRKACGKDAEITFRAVYTEDEAEARHLLEEWYENHYSQARTLQVDVPDGDAGSQRYSFEVLLESLNFDAEAGSAEPVLMEAVLRPTGTFTWAEVGS